MRDLVWPLFSLILAVIGLVGRLRLAGEDRINEQEIFTTSPLGDRIAEEA